MALRRRAAAKHAHRRVSTQSNDQRTGTRRAMPFVQLWSQGVRARQKREDPAKPSCASVASTHPLSADAPKPKRRDGLRRASCVVGRDSEPRLRAVASRANAQPPFRKGRLQLPPPWSQTGSNRRPPACKAGALPAELWPRAQGMLTAVRAAFSTAPRPGGAAPARPSSDGSFQRPIPAPRQSPRRGPAVLG